MFSVIVGNKSLQPSDTDALSLFAANALAFTLSFLRTDSSADCRQRTGSGDDLISAFDIFVYDTLDKGRYIDRNRTGSGAWFCRTVQTAPCFFQRHFIGIAERHFIKIPSADHGILHRHRASFGIHIFLLSHFSALLFEQIAGSLTNMSFKVTVHGAAVHRFVKIY